MDRAMTKKKTVLCIDDEDSVLSIMETGLSELGYNVVTAMSPKKAQEALANNNVDIIVMDIMMPELDGITFTREIHADPKTSHIPIVICSGLDDPATLNDAMLFGAVDYLVKPVDLKALQAKLLKALDIAEKRRGAAS